MSKEEWVEQFVDTLRAGKWATLDMPAFAERAWATYWREAPDVVARRFLHLLEASPEA